MATLPFLGPVGKYREPLTGARLIIVVSACGFLLFLLWASLAHVDEVTRGQGKVIPSSKLQVITAADPAVVRAALSGSELPEDAWDSKFVPYDRLPDELGVHNAGFCFHSHGLSAAGGSSTKVGEYWAMGIPVIATPGLGDVDEIIARERVGVVVRDHSDQAYRAGLDELRGLLEDAELPDRCRAAAERHYGLDQACRRQVAVYEELARGRGRA